MMQLTHLPARGVIAVTGPDRVEFLQGLVSNDVALAASGRAVWAALLSPQGKWLADFFILAHGAELLLDCEAGQIPMLLARLSRYRLRSQVSLRDASAEWAVHAAWGAKAPDAPVVAVDARLPDAGWRVLAPAPLPANAREADWDRHRLALGLPDGSRDLEADKTVLLEAGFDELGGVSWSKGCYMGQELTARTKYRGLIKRRLVPVAVQGALPAAGTPILRDGAEVGTLHSGRDGIAMATVRLAAMDGELRCGEAWLRVRVPDWMRLPEAAC